MAQGENVGGEKVLVNEVLDYLYFIVTIMAHLTE